MARGSFVVHRGWPKQLVRGAKAASAQHEIAQRLADEIRANLPIHSGELAAEWGDMTPTAAIGSDGLPAMRLPIESHVWHLIEYGSINNEAYAPIRRAADAVRLKFESGGPG